MAISSCGAGARTLALIVCLALPAAPPHAQPAQAWPQRAVRFIVPFGPGSATDIDARLLADQLARRWGKAVVIDNRPGADGLVAIGAFTAANDEYTLLFASAGTFTVHPYQHERLPYDERRDLKPIASVSAVVLAISARKSLPADTLSDLVALARARPGAVSVATAQGLSEFLLSGLEAATNIRTARIPYRDIVQAANDLAEGRIDVLMTSLAVALPTLQAGRIKVLAVNSRKRAAVAPEIPTATEAGYPSMVLEALNGLFGPRSMSDELRDRIAADVLAVAADPVLGERLGAVGQTVLLAGPTEYAAAIDEQRAQLASIAKAAGLKGTHENNCYDTRQKSAPGCSERP